MFTQVKKLESKASVTNGPFTLGGDTRASRAAQALDARVTNHVVAPSVNPA